MPIELAFDLQVNYLHKKTPPKATMLYYSHGTSLVVTNCKLCGVNHFCELVWRRNLPLRNFMLTTCGINGTAGSCMM